MLRRGHVSSGVGKTHKTRVTVARPTDIEFLRKRLSFLYFLSVVLKCLARLTDYKHRPYFAKKNTLGWCCLLCRKKENLWLLGLLCIWKKSIKRSANEQPAFRAGIFRRYAKQRKPTAFLFRRATYFSFLFLLFLSMDNLLVCASCVCPVCLCICGWLLAG